MSTVVAIFGKILEYFYCHTGDYGIAIVCLTVLAKLCLVPFQVYQRRSMEKQEANPSGCLMLLLQIPVMVCLYRSIGASLNGQISTRLFPWVESLMLRDAYGIIPALSALTQLIPQTFPYISFFKKLNLPKPAPGMIVSSVLMTLIICFPLPSGIGIYYFTSGLFSAGEQTVWNIWKVIRTDQKILREF